MAIKRVQNSYGTYHHNKGISNPISEEKFVLDKAREFYLFDLIPFGAVRMTKRDTIFTNPNHPDPKKRQREAVTKYFAFKNALSAQALMMGYELKKTLDIVFIVPLPESYSNIKKKKLIGMPCKKKPDIDNYVKAVLDTLKKEDGDVWLLSAIKIYGYLGSVIIFN